MNIAALISGGVDSAVVVHLLCEQGYKPALFYIKIGMGKGATSHQPTFQVDPAALMPAVRYLSRLLLRWGEEKG